MAFLLSVRPSQGFWGFREKGYLFSGIWGEGSFIFRDLGRKHGFSEQGAGGLRKNILGSWGERSFFFQGAGSKDPPPPGRASSVSCYKPHTQGVKWGQNFALCPTRSNRKSPWGKDPNAKTPSFPLHCGYTRQVIAPHLSPAIPHPSP